ncbi:MAG: lamin tail domain-containing protein [Flavobacteriales bacterium]|nr:lamin tail domain-containing protein [Flavobacteriales bacterium]
MKTILLPFLAFISSNLLIAQFDSLAKYDLLISEIMSDPKPSVGFLEEEEYLEIVNNSGININLKSIQINIGNKIFEPDSFWLQPDSFKVFFNIPTLKNSGDVIQITQNNRLLHEVIYHPNMFSDGFKENGGWSLELTDFSQPCITNGNWLACDNLKGGTPGEANSMNQVINGESLQISNIYAIEDTALMVEFNQPLESIKLEDIHIPQLSLHGFTIQQNELTISISKMDTNKVYDLTLNNAQNCTQYSFEPQHLQFGLPSNNTPSKIVINEILFNPDPAGSDFVELFNFGNQIIDISKLHFTDRDAEQNLNASTPISLKPLLLLPKSYLVITENQDWLISQFSSAKNSTQTNLPALNNDGDNLILITTNGTIIDELSYDEKWHYNELNSTENVSLERINPAQPNISSNWHSASSIENFATPGYENSNLSQRISTKTGFELPYNLISLNNDGHQDLLEINYKFNSVGWTGKIDVLNYEGITIHTLSNGDLFGLTGSIYWNGELANNKIIKAGIYALTFSCFNLKTQEKITQKMTFYINRSLQ